MKLATLNNHTRDGQLAVVSRDLARCVVVPELARTMQDALDDWDGVAPTLNAIAVELNAGRMPDAEPFVAARAMAPLPRAYQWADGSAYVNHVELVRQARGAALPESFKTDPLIYQGGCDHILGAARCNPAARRSVGLRFRGGSRGHRRRRGGGHARRRSAQAHPPRHAVNDVSLRNLIPGELEKGFGFFQSKPSSAFSPVAVTPDALGDAWRDGKLHRPRLAQRRTVRPSQCRRRYGLRFRPAHRPRRAHA